MLVGGEGVESICHVFGELIANKFQARVTMGGIAAQKRHARISHSVPDSNRLHPGLVYDACPSKIDLYIILCIPAAELVDMA